MAYSFKRIPFSKKEEWGIAIYCIMEEFQKHYSQKKKKPNAKRSHIIRFQLHGMLKKVKSVEIESRLMFACGWRGEKRVSANRQKESFWDIRTVLKLKPGTVTRLDKYSKNHIIVHLTWVNFMICQLYFNRAVLEKV